ncbi:hypothetical protein MHK_009819 [Candidatus Magnetomorum sp. HK-1]|nr:hypothetical protein MHK_009819 [Candidatus Magnetomorum sp. HK-1]
MHYPLPETIGSPDLFVGREKELEHLNEWLERIFNLVWSNPQMGNESGEIWDIACSAPHRYAAQYDTRVLVIIDEFQYFSNHIFVDSNLTKLDKGLTDGTLYLVLRHRFEEEIKHHKPDLKTDFQKKIGMAERIDYL